VVGVLLLAIAVFGALYLLDKIKLDVAILGATLVAAVATILTLLKK
jgi:hypothetical protein